MHQTIASREFYYDVFLSYRHKPRDNRICKKAHTLLETFKPPRRHKSADIRRVFRDDEELPAAGVLSDTIDDALRGSRILLVICSRDTPQSQWVDREVRTFIELGRSDKIFALLLEGDPSQCFPHSLKLVPGIEGRTLNIAARSERQMIKNLKKHLLRVVAAATETPFEPLRIAVRSRKISRSVAAGILLSIFLFASGFYSLYQWTKASYYNIYAQREELLIHDIINSISFGLTESVMSLPGASVPMTGILIDNIEYLDRMIDIGGPTEKVLTAKGNSYLNLAKVYMLQGEGLKAKDSARQAVRIFEDLGKISSGPDVDIRLAITYNLAGLFMQSQSDYDEAIYSFGKAAAVYGELYKGQREESYLLSQADCLNSMAYCYYLKSEYKEAASCFIDELKLRKSTLGAPPTLDEQVMLADLNAMVGSCLVDGRDFIRAEAYNAEALKLYESVFKLDSLPQYHKPYITQLYAMALNQTFLEDFKSADHHYRLALVEADKLVKLLPEFDPVYLGMYAIYDLLFADEAKNEEALRLASLAYQANPQDNYIRRVYAYSLLCNGYTHEALAEVNALIVENQSAMKQVELDVELFTVRGRYAQEMACLKEGLAVQ